MLLQHFDYQIVTSPFSYYFPKVEKSNNLMHRMAHRRHGLCRFFFRGKELVQVGYETLERR